MGLFVHIMCIVTLYVRTRTCMPCTAIVIVRIIVEMQPFFFFSCVDNFRHSYKLVTPRLLEMLNGSENVSHDTFKGILHVLLGPKHDGKLLVRKDWQIVKELWPLLVASKHSEKPRQVVNICQKK